MRGASLRGPEEGQGQGAVPVCRGGPSGSIPPALLVRTHTDSPMFQVPVGAAPMASPGPCETCPSCPLVPPSFPRLGPASRPQGPQFVPATPGHHCHGSLPEKGCPSQERPRASERERAGAGRVDSERLLPRGQTPRCVDRLHTTMSGELRPGAKCHPGGTWNHLMKRVIWGCLLYKPKEMYT